MSRINYSYTSLHQFPMQLNNNIAKSVPPHAMPCQVHGQHVLQLDAYSKHLSSILQQLGQNHHKQLSSTNTVLSKGQLNLHIHIHRFDFFVSSTTVWQYMTTIILTLSLFTSLFKLNFCQVYASMYTYGT